MTALDMAWTAAAVLLAVSGALVTLRILAGPGTLDRLVALDTLAATIQCALAVYVAWTLDTTVIAAILALALLGFLGAVGITRFRVRDHALPGAAPAGDRGTR